MRGVGESTRACVGQWKWKNGPFQSYYECESEKFENSILLWISLERQARVRAPFTVLDHVTTG